ncbi:hypothetical protein O9992_02175 [Vibrio lentus]|nr:hypothetical protein [Vibrio lentus]
MQIPLARLKLWETNLVGLSLGVIPRLYSSTLVFDETEHGKITVATPAKGPIVIIRRRNRC